MCNVNRSWTWRGHYQGTNLSNGTGELDQVLKDDSNYLGIVQSCFIDFNEKKVNNIHYNYMDILHKLGVFHESLPVNVIALW